jgi:hypothetical protein
MRGDYEPQRAALAAAALGRVPGADILGTIHPVARYYLSDVTRFLDDEQEPRIGSPVRLCGSPDWEPRTRVSIEYCFHDDHQAAGGYMFWVWLFDLVQRPDLPRREVIGYDGIYRNAYDMDLLYATREGIVVRDVTMTWSGIEETLADWSQWESFAENGPS